MNEDFKRSVEEENKYLKRRIEEIENQALIGLWELDHQSNILYWDSFVHKLFGVLPEQFEGTIDGFIKRVHPQDRERVEASYAKSLEKKHPYQIDHRLLLDDGSIKYVHEWCRTKYDDDGNPLISFGTVQDITERKQSEIEKRQVAKQIYQLSHLAALGELASGIAHEINNPLAILKGYNDLIRKRVDQCSGCNFKDIISNYIEGERNSLKRLEQVIHSLKSYNFKANQHMSIFSVVEQVGSSVDFIRSIYENDGILVTHKHCDKDIFVEGYPNYFQQILMNLYSNSKDALENVDSPQITIEFEIEGNNVLIKVIDNGEGIDAETIQYIFDFSFTTKAEGKGTGFGLHLVDDFMKKMNGSVSVESKKGEFTSFTLVLPIHHFEEVQQEQVENLTEKNDSLEKKYRFLVVDDEVDIAEYLGTLLEFEGHEAVCVTSGVEALKKIETEEFDAVFTDIVMPEMNGQALLRKLTQMNYLGKRVIVSGNFFPQAKSVALSYDEVLDKPFTKDDLLEVLNKLF